jgi:hypothetical protein
MKAFFRAKDQLKQDEIAAKTGLALQPWAEHAFAQLGFFHVGEMILLPLRPLL